MSLASLLEFRAKINETPALQEELRPHMAPSLMTFSIQRIGKKHGFDFTQEEVIELYYAEMARESRELSDFELELVAGGTSGPTGPSTFAGQPAPKE